MQQLRLFFAMALLYMFRVTIPPIIRSTYAVYGLRHLSNDCLSNVSNSGIHWLRHWRKSEMVVYISYNVTTPDNVRDRPEIGLSDGL